VCEVATHRTGSRLQGAGQGLFSCICWKEYFLQCSTYSSNTVVCCGCVCVCVHARACTHTHTIRPWPFVRDQDLGQVTTTVNVSYEYSRVSNTCNQCGERVVPTLMDRLIESREETAYKGSHSACTSTFVCSCVHTWMDSPWWKSSVIFSYSPSPLQSFLSRLHNFTLYFESPCQEKHQWQESHSLESPCDVQNYE